MTSSYLEGVCNQPGAFGDNWDGKRGKQQVVELKELCTTQVWVRAEFPSLADDGQ